MTIADTRVPFIKATLNDSQQDHTLYMFANDMLKTGVNVAMATFLVRDLPPQSVPEPGTLALMLAGLGVVIRKRRQKA